MQEQLRLQVSRVYRSTCGTLAEISLCRKHQRVHIKPYKCSIRDCKYAGQGFATKNDLDRHNKSKHSLLTGNSNDKSYKCASKDCNVKEKIWPRQDNFRCHCESKHKSEDLKDLMKRYFPSSVSLRFQPSLTILPV